MQAYADFVELARICARNSYNASKDVSVELWKMAREYQQEAAKLNGGLSPDIGKPPPWIPE
jgi:hypothetical protein